ncbi:hypothetical protein HGRIS_003625 [Hohenbuehelia grisea]|uniref:Uncharacterized protein n=1 Tax=Hohenbuehelia grisea TaxID=104357 RepID=A0ABR3JG39_9AGAR
MLSRPIYFALLALCIFSVSVDAVPSPQNGRGRGRGGQNRNANNRAAVNRNGNNRNAGNRVGNNANTNNRNAANANNRNANNRNANNRNANNRNANNRNANNANNRNANNVNANNANANNGQAGNNGNPQTSRTLDPRVIAQGFANNGQDQPTAGQVASLTSTNNFINFCLTAPNLPITNGRQVQTGSCNPAPIGMIPAVQRMPSSKFTFPRNLATLRANSAFTISMAVRNLETGNFVNAQQNYFSAPQQLNNQGTIRGHSHVVIERITSLEQTTPTDPRVFEFFKGLNGRANNGVLTADVPRGLPVGTYRLASINSAANHQPVIVPIAQHGSLDDMVYFTVTNDGRPAANAAVNNAAANNANANNNNNAAANRNNNANANNRNAANRNAANRNAANRNAANRNTGNRNAAAANRNTANRNAANQNANRNTANRQAANRNTGNRQAANRQTAATANRNRNTAARPAANANRRPRAA